MPNKIEEKLDFYYVSEDYVKYLQDGEAAHRGFTCVPDVDYGPVRPKKFMCGIVLYIGERKYLAPVSTYRKQQPNNVLLYGENGNVTSSVRLNFMFPIVDGVFNKLIIKNISDVSYRRHVDGELKSVLAQEGAIRALALSTYQSVTGQILSGLCVNWACDFKYLEKLSDAYKNNTA